jgi:hypothetical protein
VEAHFERAPLLEETNFMCCRRTSQLAQTNFSIACISSNGFSAGHSLNEKLNERPFLGQRKGRLGWFGSSARVCFEL